MNTSRVAASVGLVLVCVSLLLLAPGCPPPANAEPFEVLLVNGTPFLLNIFFNTAMQNPSPGAANRIDVAAGSVATARFSAEDLDALGAGTQFLLFASAPGAGSGLALNNPQQVVPNHQAGGRAAALISACGATGNIQILQVAP